MLSVLEKTNGNPPMGFYVGNTTDGRTFGTSITSSQFTNAACVSSGFAFPSGNFILLPCTFQPGQTGAFNLTIYSSSRVTVHSLN
jgi:hypothetical protein